MKMVEFCVLYCFSDGGEEEDTCGDQRGVRASAEGAGREEATTENQPQGGQLLNVLLIVLI